MRLVLSAVVALACSDGAGPAPGSDASLDAPEGVDGGPPLDHTVVETADLGMVAADPATGLGPLVGFDVPADAVSFLLVADGERGVNYTFDTLTAPDGTALVLSGWLTTSDVPVCLACRNRVLSERSAVALLDPIAPLSFIAPGRWYARLQASTGALPPVASPGSAKLSVLVKRSPAPVTSGVIDVALHLTGSHGLTAATAPSDSRVQKALVRVGAILDQAGVALGEVTYRDVSADLQAVDSDDLEDLFAARDAKDDALAVFLVADLTSHGTPLLGLTAVPGAYGATLRSGVALSSDPTIDVPLGGDPLGPAMAHEIGHYLGLFHTRELKGSIFDPLDDTPEQSHDNLMTPDLRGTTLSAEQGSVMRLHPVVR